MCKNALTTYYYWFFGVNSLTFALSLAFRIVFDFLFSLFILSLLWCLFQVVNGQELTIEINVLFPLINGLSLFLGVSCYCCILRLLEGFI